MRNKLLLLVVVSLMVALLVGSAGGGAPASEASLSLDEPAASPEPTQGPGPESVDPVHPCSGTSAGGKLPWVDRCYNGSVTLANYDKPGSVLKRLESNLAWKLIQDVAGLQKVDAGGQYVSGGQIAAITVFLYAGGHLGWAHDVAPLTEDIRQTGPVIEGYGFDTHQRVRIFYSDEVVDWLRGGREGSIPNRAVIVKQMYASDPADDEYGADRVSGWAVMVRNTNLSADGWLWYLYFFAHSPPYNAPGPVFYAQAGDSFCLSCHATADNDMSTFSALSNLEGAPQQYTWVDQAMPGIFTERAAASIPLTKGDHAALHKLLASGVAQFQKLGESASEPAPHAQEQPSALVDLRKAFDTIKKLGSDGKEALLKRLAGEDTAFKADDLTRLIGKLEQVLHDENAAGPIDQYLVKYLNLIYLQPVVKPLDSPDPDVLAAYSSEAQATLPEAEADAVSFPGSIMLSHTPSLPGQLPAEVCAKHNSLDGSVQASGSSADAGSETEECRDVYITSDNCLGCHGPYVLQGGTLPNMVTEVLDDEDTVTELWDISPYGEWSTSMMGLAGRDPIFHAQLSWERENRPNVADQISNLCTRCHQAAAQRQYHLDHRDAKDPAAIDPPSESVEGPLFTSEFTPLLPKAYIDTPSKWGALGRDGITCAVCHQIEAKGLGDPSTFTGQFDFPDEAGTIYGPFEDDNIKPFIMEQSMALTPTHGVHMTESELCGSCHTVVTPIINELQDGSDAAYRTTYEQSTYPEWLNSVYSGEEEQSCQDCHMPARVPDAALDVGTTLTETIANVESAWLPPVENRAADDLITPDEKDGFKRHTLVALNQFGNQMFQQFPKTLGASTTNKAAGLPNLKASILLTPREMQRLGEEQTVDLAIAQVDGATNAFDVTVENKVGHKFPSGVGFRRAFIRFEALDADGNVQWASGRTNRAGQIVDNASVVIENEITSDPLRIQPGAPLIDDEADVYIFEERTATWPGKKTREASGGEDVDLSQMVLSTSFLEIVTEAKDTRLLPKGWSPDGPYADVTHLSILNPESGKAESFNPDTPGTRVVRYQLPESLAGVAAVRASILYQSIPPYYIQDRLEYDTPEIQRLYYMVTHLNTGDAAVEGSVQGWVTKLTETELVVK